METETRALTVTNEDIAPRMVMTLDEAKYQLEQLQSFVKSVMVPDEDYGVIPGTKKPTLLKSGAEKLNEIYGYAPMAEITTKIEDWEKGFFYYEVKVSLVSKRTGATVAQGLGSCNSKEKRYSDRWVTEKKLPEGVDKDTLQRREKTGQYGPYFEYLVPNDDIYSLVNTVLKMAKKRALIDATLSATRSSGIFTQDMEDLRDTVEPERGNAKQQGGSAQARVDNGAKASEAQRKAVFAIARSKLNLDSDQTQALCVQECGCRAGDLTKAQASTLIDGMQRGQIQLRPQDIEDAEIIPPPEPEEAEGNGFEQAGLLEDGFPDRTARMPNGDAAEPDDVNGPVDDVDVRNLEQAAMEAYGSEAEARAGLTKLVRYLKHQKAEELTRQEARQILKKLHDIALAKVK